MAANNQGIIVYRISGVLINVNGYNLTGARLVIQSAGRVIGLPLWRVIRWHIATLRDRNEEITIN